MNYCFTIVIIILLSILIILYICSIIFESIYISGNDKIKNIILDLLVSDIILSTFMIIVNSYLIYTALYFFSKNQMVLFLVLMIIFLLIKLFLVLIITNNEKISLEYSYINMAIFIIIAQMGFQFITFIFGLFYKYQLNKDLDESPLNRVDEFITEEMYKNILRQSLSPNDVTLKKDFEKQFEQRKSEMTRNIISNDLK